MFFFAMQVTWSLPILRRKFYVTIIKAVFSHHKLRAIIDKSLNQWRHFFLINILTSSKKKNGNTNLIQRGLKISIRFRWNYYFTYYDITLRFIIILFTLTLPSREFSRGIWRDPEDGFAHIMNGLNITHAFTAHWIIFRSNRSLKVVLTIVNKNTVKSLFPRAERFVSRVLCYIEDVISTKLRFSTWVFL